MVSSYHHSAPDAVDASRMPADKSRSEKFDAITRAASEMFLAEGFDRASLDQIAQRAGVSKQTIYSHFTDKEALFLAICAELTDKLTIPLRQPTQNEARRDLEGTLVQLGDQALEMMLHPASLDLHRLVLSAAARFPDIGRAAYEAGAQRMIDDLSAVLIRRSHLRDGLRGPLAEPEARRLVEQFMGMLRGFHQIRGLLGVPAHPAAERKAYVRSCVAILLRGAAA